MSIATDPAKPVIEFVREDELRLVFRVLLPIRELSVFSGACVPWSQLAQAEYTFEMPTPALDRSDSGRALQAAVAFAERHGLEPLVFFHDVLTAFSRSVGDSYHYSNRRG